MANVLYHTYHPVPIRPSHYRDAALADDSVYRCTGKLPSSPQTPFRPESVFYIPFPRRASPRECTPRIAHQRSPHTRARRLHEYPEPEVLEKSAPGIFGQLQ